MRNLSKLVFQRVVGVSLSILLQLAAMLVFVDWLAEYQQWFGALMTALRIFFTVFLVTGRTNPAYKIAWLLLILPFPVAGVSLYLFLGGNRLSRWERKRLTGLAAALVGEQREREETRLQLESTHAGAARQSRYLKKYAYSPLVGGTKTEYFPCGEDCFPRMLEDLKTAEKYIFLEYFIVEEGKMWGSILEILTEKARQGVDVRLIYDDFGCIRRLPARYSRELKDLGISARAFNPFVPVVSGRLNNRDHRKLMIVDGKIGYTGGINLADEYINEGSRFGYWKDAGLRLEGPGVWSMTVQFLAMWNYLHGTAADPAAYRPKLAEYTAGGFVQSFGDMPLDGEAVGETALLNLINGAEKSVFIMTPYLVLDDKMTAALSGAAKRGLDVRIVTPGIPDKWYVYAVTRANYPALLEAGVKIYEFAPGFLHSKVFLADGSTAVVGTVNLDFRSLYLHFENAVWMHGADCIRQIGEDFEKTFPRCRRVTLSAVQATPWYVRLGRRLLHLLAPLM